MKLVTIGVYGFSEDAFFRALQEKQVDVFCDIRQRRGVRGAQYAFVNSQRLQKRLAKLGIAYLHCKELAPTTAIRQHQSEVDRAQKIPKRERSTLSPDFIASYRKEVLDHFDPQSLLHNLPSETKVIALFCVEREPAACHRSLVAEKLQQKTGVEVEHVLP